MFSKIRAVVPGWTRHPVAAPPLARHSPAPDSAQQEQRQRGGTGAAAAVLEAAATTPPSHAGSPPPDTAAGSFGYARLPEGRYRVEKELGRGGNGVVTLVMDTATGKQFAMKSIPKVAPGQTADGFAAGGRRLAGGWGA